MVMKAVCKSVKYICKCKALDDMSLYYFWLGSVSKDFGNNEMSEISLNGTMYDFSTDCGLIGQRNILNIHEYLGYFRLLCYLRFSACNLLPY